MFAVKSSISNISISVQRSAIGEVGYCKSTAKVGCSISTYLLYSIAASVFLGSNSVQSCPVAGCLEGKCTLVGANSICSECSQGYYLSSDHRECVRCSNTCTKCTSSHVCQSCSTGHYLHDGTKTCISCGANCDQCVDSSGCTVCAPNHKLSGSTRQCVSSVSNQIWRSVIGFNSSGTGAVIGYVVSAVVCLLCCTIAIVHHSKKQRKSAKVAPVASASTTATGGAIQIVHDDPGAQVSGAASSGLQTAIRSKSPVSIKSNFAAEADQLSSVRGPCRAFVKHSHRLVTTSQYDGGLLSKIPGQLYPGSARYIGRDQQVLSKSPHRSGGLKPWPSIRPPTNTMSNCLYSEGSARPDLSLREMRIARPKEKDYRLGNMAVMGGSSRSIVQSPNGHTKLSLFDSPRTRTDVQSPHKNLPRKLKPEIRR